MVVVVVEGSTEGKVKAAVMGSVAVSDGTMFEDGMEEEDAEVRGEKGRATGACENKGRQGLPQW